MVLWILHGTGGLSCPQWGNIVVGAKAGQAMVETRLGELTSTEQGPTSGSHHAALPCAAVSRVGPSVWNIYSNPWSSWLLSSSRSRLECQLLGDASLNTAAKALTLVNLITLLCFPHSAALGPGSKILPYLHYHLSLDSLHVASCTIRSSMLPTCLALRRLQWVFLDEWTSGPEPSFNFWLLQKEQPVAASKNHVPVSGHIPHLPPD